MPVQATCPHCSTPCVIGEQHVGQVVRCFKCAQVFRLHGAASLKETPSAIDDSDQIPQPTFDVELEPRTRMSLDISGATTAGRVRERNEDALLVRRQSWSRQNEMHELVLLAVADGMGGYDGGEQASTLTIRELQWTLGPLFDGALIGQIRPEQSAGDLLRRALNRASQAVHAAAAADTRLKGMGAAAVVALLWDNQAFIGHVGDCRAYHFRAGALHQATKDQTLIQRMLDLGTLSAAEAEHHPARNELSQAIGRRPDVAPEVCQLSLDRDDWLILACDGLQTHLGHDELRQEIELALPAASFLADRLVAVANERGGSDNCTVIAVRCL